MLTRRALFTASAINGAGFVMGSLVTVVWYFLIVRSYDGASSGQLLLALSVAGLINLLDFGVSLGLVAMIANAEPARMTHVPRTLFRCAVWFSGCAELALGIAAVCGWQAGAPVRLPLHACACIVAFAISTQIIMLCASALKGLCDFKAANLVSTGSTLLVYGPSSVMALFGLDVWAIFGAMALAQTIAATCSILYTGRRLGPGPQLGLRRLAATYAELLKLSLKFFPQMFTGIFFMHAQRFIMARVAGLEAVAPLSFAYSVATRIHSVVNAFLEVIFPMARQIRAQGASATHFCLRTGALSALAYAVGAAIAALMAQLLMPVIVPALLVFAIGVMFAIASAPAFHLLNGSGESALVSMCSLFSPILFVGLAPLLSRAIIHGPLLLPVAYAITMAIMLLQVALLVRRHSQRHIPT